MMRASENPVPEPAPKAVHGSEDEPSSTSARTGEQLNGHHAGGHHAGGHDAGGHDAGDPVTGSGAQKPDGLRWYERLFGLRKRAKADLREDLADALAGDHKAHHSFSAEERAMLHSVLALQDIRVEDVMVPRADIDAVETTTTLGELLRLFEQSGHSRMPVYGETLDDPRGMVHIRDVVAHITKASAMSRSETARRKNPPAANLDLKKVNLDKSLAVLKLVRPVLFVPPSMLAANLMARMQANRIQMALVIDEYGGTEGLVSLEDLVEEIVGDIEDEHDDDDEPEIIDKGDGVFILDAKAELEDVAEAVGDAFQVGEHAEDADTIGGLVFALTGRVPLRGEVIEGLGFEFRVIDADPRRIKRIELARAKTHRKRPPAVQ